MLTQVAQHQPPQHPAIGHESPVEWLEKDHKCTREHVWSQCSWVAGCSLTHGRTTDGAIVQLHLIIEWLDDWALQVKATREAMVCTGNICEKMQKQWLRVAIPSKFGIQGLWVGVQGFRVLGILGFNMVQCSTGLMERAGHCITPWRYLVSSLQTQIRRPKDPISGSQMASKKLS